MAIFFGVATALLGQAWFENRADRIQEQELLRAVLDEMEVNLEGTTVGLSQVQIRRAELQAFHGFLGSTDAASDPDSVVGGAAQLLQTYSARVVSPALEYALQATNLRLIQNPEVREMLTSYQNRIRLQREFTDDHQDWTNQTVRSFVIANAVVRDRNENDGRTLSALVGTTFPRSRFSGVGEQLIRSREFDNLVLDQIYWHLLIERRMALNADALPGYLAQLRSELRLDD